MKKPILFMPSLLFLFCFCLQTKILAQDNGVNTKNSFSLSNLKADVLNMGKPEWESMLVYLANLHEKSIHPCKYPFQYEWEEIGPGYCYGPAFGHWDIVHSIMDVLPSEIDHAQKQILNYLGTQQADGMLPSPIWFKSERRSWGNSDSASWFKTAGHPPLWQFAVDEITRISGNNKLIKICYDPLLKQILWLENNRKAEPNGFYYTDILNHLWESGIDEGIRFDSIKTGPFACIDATAHVYSLYEHAARWSELLGKPSELYREKAEKLKIFIQRELFDNETGFFYDIWAIRDTSKRRMAFEGMWPLVVGAATKEQANRVIDENLLNNKRFFSKHGISSVGLTDPHFELRMWRGCSWNSMSYWAARGCIRYSRKDAAQKILQSAIDDSVVQFERTGTVWEFYHPLGGIPENLQRKPNSEFNIPSRDYLGHNPLIAMVKLLEEINNND